MSVARKRSTKAARAADSPIDSDDLVDTDVPAAVVCAHCGDADCPGCEHETTRSGVVAVVAWERPGTGFFVRLWATARASTFDADQFFECLPDGPLGPALRFAFITELVASAAMVTLLTIPALLVTPGWIKHLFIEQPLTAARLIAVGVPGLAILLVLAHAAHGWALDFGARRSGVRGATTRALRFGLYATGWDLVVGPLGALIVGIGQGPSAALSIARVGVGLPGRSARAFLRGCYRLEGAGAAPALRVSFVAAALATLVGAVVVIAALLAALAA